MTIFIHVEMPGHRGYSLSFKDAKRAAQAYSAERKTPGATVSVDIQFGR